MLDHFGNSSSDFDQYTDETKLKIIKEEHHEKGKPLERIADRYGSRIRTLAAFMEEHNLRHLKGEERREIEKKWLRQHARDILGPCPIQKQEKTAREALMTGLKKGERR